MEAYVWGERGLWADLRQLGRVALKHISPQPLASHGDHFNHLPVPDSEAIEIGDTIHEFQWDDSLYLGQNPKVNQPYRHPFDSRPTEDTREL